MSVYFLKDSKSIQCKLYKKAFESSCSTVCECLYRLVCASVCVQPCRCVCSRVCVCAAVCADVCKCMRVPTLPPHTANQACDASSMAGTNVLWQP